MADEHVITVNTEQGEAATIYRPTCSCGNYPTRRNKHIKFLNEYDAKRAGHFHVLGSKYSRYHV